VDAARIFEQLRFQFGDAILETAEDKLPVARVAPARLRDVAARLKDTPGLDFDLLVGVTAVDYEDRFEMVYHLRSLKQGHTLVLKVSLGREDPVVPSLVPLWQGATLQEREVYDLFGIRFDGHPNLRRLFLWDAFPGHPLRKDFRYTTSIPYREKDEGGSMKDEASEQNTDRRLTTED
jgi:NADH-quinone oxidoreductase subunit C